MANGDDIVRVAEKVRKFRADHPIDEYAIWTDFTEDVVGDVARVVGRCRIVHLATMKVVALAYGTRALRAPIPGAQGMRDTRDPDRAQTQATGRALGLLGYAAGDSLEGDTDEADTTGVDRAVPVDAPYGVSEGKQWPVKQAKLRLIDLVRAHETRGGKATPSVEQAKADAAALWAQGWPDPEQQPSVVAEGALVRLLSTAEPFPAPSLPPTSPREVPVVPQERLGALARTDPAVLAIAAAHAASASGVGGDAAELPEAPASPLDAPTPDDPPDDGPTPPRGCTGYYVGDNDDSESVWGHDGPCEYHLLDEPLFADDPA